MANLCGFIARVKGDKANVKKFIDAMEQKNGVWLGRGAETSICDDDDFNDMWNDKDSSIEFDGTCKNGVENAMIDCALSMRKQAQTGKGMWGDLEKGTEYYTLFEYARKLGIEFEMYSTENGCSFAEHIAYTNELGEVNETTYYNEIWIEDYETLEECQKDYPEVTQEMWDDSDGSIIEIGGFDTSVWNL